MIRVHIRPAKGTAHVVNYKFLTVKDIRHELMKEYGRHSFTDVTMHGTVVWQFDKAEVTLTGVVRRAFGYRTR